MHKFATAVVSLDRENHSIENVMTFVDEAVASGSKLVVLPFAFPYPLPEDAETFFGRLAKEKGIHLIAGYEKDRRQIAAIFSSDGVLCGTYAQTHRLPDEEFEQGDEIRPIATPFGKVGLSVGSDIYFPEIQWSLVQQGADLLVHLDKERCVSDHYYSVLSPRVRALDVHRPFLIARGTSDLVKLVHNEEFGIAGVPMAGSVIVDQNGAVLASTGFSQGVARADLRLSQHCRVLEKEGGANIPISRGLDIWKLYFNDSRKKFFSPLRTPFAPAPKPPYKKRKIRVAVLSHPYSVQIGSADGMVLQLLKEACRHQPDIIVTTEMEQECQPDEPTIASALDEMTACAKEVGSYLLVGGMRPKLSDTELRRTSVAWLWDREGKKVFESAIMLYGRGLGQEAFDTDFGRIGIRLCGDVYAPELDRLFALQGVDIVFNPSMSWGASGLINTELNQVRAMDNGHYVVSGHLSFSDAAQRSHVIDPLGVVVAASQYNSSSVLLADIDLDRKGGVFVSDGMREVPKDAYLRAYRRPHTHRLLSHEELLTLRRPSLYEALEEDRPDHPFTTRDRGDGVKIEFVS